MTRLISGIFLLSLMISCGEFGPNPSSFVGQYDISIKELSKLDRTSINNDMKNMTTELESTLREFGTAMKDIRLADIDTSTIEGKIEFLSKSLSQNIGDLTMAIGKESGQSIGKMIETLVDGGLKIGESAMKNLKMTAELQKDGDFKMSFYPYESKVYANTKWRIEGSHFFVYTDEEEIYRFKVQQIKKNGFELKNEDMVLAFANRN
jgi:hypothetical protein